MKSSSGGAESAGAMEIAVKFLGWHAFECNAYLAASAQACTCRNSDLAAAIDAALEAARRDERERCAKIADSHNNYSPIVCVIAREIRSLT